jgi:penicillin-binding protein 1C
MKIPRKIRIKLNNFKKIDFKKLLKSRKFWLWFFVSCFTAIVLGFLLVILLMMWFAKDLPAPNKIARQEGYASRIYDRNGEVIYDVYKDAKRTPVKWEEIGDDLKKATIAVEDKDFYVHKGIDPLTPFRIIKNYFVMGRLTGGSTLTQQLVKNVLLTSERTITRKLKEFILAIQIESKYSKDEILLMYLNEAPYGGMAFGVASGAEQYFGKDVGELTLAESVILAGMPQRPSVYSPFSRTPTAYVDRAKHVLNRMIEDGYVEGEKFDEIFEEIEEYKFNKNENQLLAPHFVFWIKDELSQKYGEEMVEGGGLEITTTLDLSLQKEIEEIVKEEIDKADKQGISNGAALVLDPITGEVLSMVGSRDYFSEDTDGKFNVVTQALRQPGSAIKPITYLTALKKGWTPESLIMDTPVTFPGEAGQKDYSPQNYTGQFYGPMSLRKALGNSINTTAVKLLWHVGLESMLQQAYSMGLNTLEPTDANKSRFGLAVTLGGAEVKMTEFAQSYCAFANGGKKVDLVAVLKVTDKEGRILEEYKHIEGKSVMTPQEAFLISDILSDNSARALTFGEVNGLQISNYQVAVKTGTTNDKRDNWAIGWTPNLLSLVWVGNNDNSPMSRVSSGVSGATPIWRRIMLTALPKKPKQDFPVPDKIISVEVDKVSGYPAHDGFESKTGYFIDGTVPKVSDPIHLKLKVCRNEFGLATLQDIANGNYEEREFFKFSESCPGCQAGIDGWIEKQENKEKYNPPTDYCREGGNLVVNIDTPGNESTVGNEFDIRVSVISSKKIESVRVYVDDEEEKSWTDKPYEGKMNLDDGTYIVKVEAEDRDGNVSSRDIKIGVNMPWDGPLPTLTPTAIPTVTPSPTGTPIPTLIPSVTVIPSGT